jgi:hypothetical protein
VGAQLFHADRRTDGWTDTTKQNAAFRNYAIASKDGTNCKITVWKYAEILNVKSVVHVVTTALKGVKVVTFIRAVLFALKHGKESA